ncbi:ribose transport system ATP-binding protein [Lachnospiraceae bacterium PM6-15]|uniref:Sugar ABC transporter ATP-binding protein n=1 Tax=Ohessyouella blattaphilus TaxID=2949333 RepID=A0ABT1EK16_9FIRM|nr:sugar ABC transporter ATP-binding protein [Ohessyouella blattaphilus]MCP1111048.1 sugar ABC transporter ATP-binding protein [Ohessyouella blattaphilus]MCR8564442.1 sugar ABC transporter ATP-binding protein [Ohessyouella blattaphilus]MDL2250459.1 sugar ABC transporter ATP-binding protein [Lachnospiraceae bacterium OttesenSCG-928-J05]
MSKEFMIEAKKMHKSFGSTVALDNVNVKVSGGEIRGLIGENGSGKSTVTSIIAGMQRANEGEMFFKGKPWNPGSMIESLENGVGMIVQESGTVPGISVAENIFLGETAQFRRGGIVSRKRLIKAAQEVLNSIGASYIKAETLTADIDMQSRKLVEIAKVMRKNPEVLIVDETTTALSQDGREIIYKIMNQMKAENKAVIFISHDLEEIMNVCDALTVLRDGKIIVTFDKDEFDEDVIKTSMIGRELQGEYYRSDLDDSYDNEVVLEIVKGELDDQLREFDFQLHKGEILGVGGLSYCGMHTLGKVLFGAERLNAGEVLAHGKPLKNEKEAMNHGIGYVSKDRDYESLSLNASIKDNISIGGLECFATGKFLLLSGKENRYVDEQIKKLSIKCQDRNQYVMTLSGGNKQKVVFGKWIGRDSEILILDCPTRGVDIGVKQAMYQLMYQMKKEGKSIVIISEEMTELLGMADRILIMKDGKKAAEFMRSDKPQEADIIKYMI